MAEQPYIIFNIGEPVVFNKSGKEAGMDIPLPNGQKHWIVESAEWVRPPPDSTTGYVHHPQLIDLGKNYPMGPVSGAYLDPVRNLP